MSEVVLTMTLPIDDGPAVIRPVAGVTGSASAGHGVAGRASAGVAVSRVTAVRATATTTRVTVRSTINGGA